MNILVTGGAGFIGTNLIKRLVNDNHIVYSIDDYSTGNISNHIDGCKYYNNDILNIRHYDNLSFLPEIDIVFHLAAKARIQPSFDNPSEYIDTNFNGTYEVVKYCVKNSIPMIYAGTSSKHSGRFKNPYTFSKDLGEDIIQLYQEHYGLKASTARFYNVYGDYQLLGGKYSTLIGRWIYNIKNNIPCTIYGDGTKRRDFTHVEDIVDGMVKVMEQKQWGRIFELGCGMNYSVNEVAEMFNITPIYMEDKPGEAIATLNIDKSAEEVLGWKPKWCLNEYIKTLTNE